MTQQEGRVCAKEPNQFQRGKGGLSAANTKERSKYLCLGMMELKACTGALLQRIVPLSTYLPVQVLERSLLSCDESLDC